MKNYQREYDKRIKVGMVGIGSHTYRNLLPIMNYLPIDLRAVCNFSNEEEGKKVAAQYGCKYYKGTGNMYENEELDAVILCVSPFRHAALAKEALEAGLHVFMEKPAGINAAEAQSMLDARGDRVVVVGYKKAFMPGCDKAVEILHDQDNFDGLRSILAVYPLTMPEDGEALLAQGKDFDWLNNGCHPMAFLLRVGGKPLAVTLHTGPANNPVAIIEFEGGVIATLHGASGPHPIESYTVFGGNWNLQVRNTDTVILNRGIPFTYGRTESFAPEGFDHGSTVWQPQNCMATLENMSWFLQGMYFEMKHFCDCVLEGRPATNGTLEMAMDIARLFEAGMRSGGQRVVLG